MLEQHLAQPRGGAEGPAAVFVLGKSAEVKGDGMQDEGAVLMSCSWMQGPVSQCSHCFSQGIAWENTA